MDFKEQTRLLTQKKNALYEGKTSLAGEGTARIGGALFDAGSFVELNAMVDEGNAVAGYGLVDGRPAYLIAQDPDLSGGAMSAAQAQKMIKALDKASNAGVPVVFLLNSQGAKVLEGLQVLSAYADVFTRMARLSGICPLIAVVDGPCVGAAAHFASLSDIVIAVESSAELLSAPASVLSAVQGVSKDGKTLGGAAQAAQQGAVSLTAPDTAAALKIVQALVGLLPSSSGCNAPFQEGDDLNRLLTDAQAASGALLLEAVADAGSVVWLYQAYAAGCHTALARVGGRPCGIVSTEFTVDGGRLDAKACDKIARFVRFCDCFDLPVITLIDSEGLAVPSADKQGWLMRASSDMLYTYADADCPKLAVITGNAVGTAFVAFAGSAVADVCYAWPGSLISPLTKEAAVQTFEAGQLKTRDRDTLEKEYSDKADGMNAARAGIVDEVIAPAQTRKYLIAAMEMLAAE